MFEVKTESQHSGSQIDFLNRLCHSASSEQKLTISRCLFLIAIAAQQCHGYIEFLLVGSHCISIVRNSTTSTWSFRAAMCRGVS